MPGYRTKPPKGSLLQRSHPLASGLVAAYLFNEGSGLTAYDSAGRNNGTFGASTAAPTWGSGAFGKCPVFDGTDDKISIPSFDVSAITISAWVYSTASVASAQRIVTKYSGSGSTNGSVIFDLQPSRVVRIIAANSGFKGATSATNVWTAGAWQHVVGTISSAGSAVYVNGRSVATGVGTTIPANATQWTIGEDETAGAAEWFKGSMDAVRIYNRALSAAEVRSLYADPFAAFRRKTLLKHPASSLLLKRRRAALS